LEVATRLGLEIQLNLLLYVDFPLLEFDEESGRYHAMHHPYVSRRYAFVGNCQESACNAYDMVLNGNEIGGGSIRIHDKATQQLMFKYLGFLRRTQGTIFLMDAFQFEPTTWRIGFWFRPISCYFRSRNHYDFIAFLKNNSGRDVMIDAPSTIDALQLKNFILI
jgi:aspartyl-tRNA synthetase